MTEKRKMEKTKKATTKKTDKDDTNKVSEVKEASEVSETKEEHKAKTAHHKAKEIEEKGEEIGETKETKNPAHPHHPKKEKYYEAIGRRKSAVSRVRLYTKVKGFTVNDKTLEAYFPILRLQKEAISPIEKIKLLDKLGASVKVQGGGPTAQAQATKLGIARALLKFNPIFTKRLRKLGLLTRDARKVERKKPGLKKARRAPQWTKR